MLWALLHLPFLLALLLLLRCVTDSLAATETIIGASIYVAIIDSIDSTVFGLFASGVSIDDYIESLRNATAFPDLSNFATSLGVDLNRQSSKGLDCAGSLTDQHALQERWKHTKLKPMAMYKASPTFTRGLCIHY